MGFLAYTALLLPLLSLFLSTPPVAALQGINLENQILDVTPINSLRDPLSKDNVLCERILISGLSRWKLSSYSSAFRVSLVPSAVIPDRLLGKIQICFHKNSSIGLCQCEQDAWKNLQKGPWSSVMSPYEDRILDVKFVGLSGSVTVTLEEDLQRWRLVFLAFGMVLLLMAPIVSSWVPFYYSSSMAIGVCLVIIVLLFQGMKLLPTGRKNIFYLTIYGSVLGAGSFLVHQFSMLINSIVSNFGLGEEFHNPVAVFVLVGIILAGAGLGYWLVRKFVISEDGSVDVGVAQFVKWALRIVGITFVFQSTLDYPLVILVLSSWWPICFGVTSMQWRLSSDLSYSGIGGAWAKNSRQMNMNKKRAEFFSKSRKFGSVGVPHSIPKSSFALSDSPVKGFSDGKGKKVHEYYSTFHKTPNRKRFSKKEWEDFTQESTKEAVAELASSPEFTDWVINHADRIQLLPEDSSDESVVSGSDSTDENAAESCSGLGLFKWHRR
ncbi:PREDICTED: uncharacterized protein LOC109237651 [Nicotiana attenuata]|uniref:Nuclear envelope integral membrane protein 1 n=1 Tax=Nicotiana attenuata TaxID=49451 RepID=A0A314LDZ6_NICAT|nr:PREDICTED: uncharacterized protein LOC109237651 [Nicotiana attenuata]OIT39772.1 hypothetical protein A4A49_02193 [Nicotiana attenuata]